MFNLVKRKSVIGGKSEKSKSSEKSGSSGSSGSSKEKPGRESGTNNTKHSKAIDLSKYYRISGGPTEWAKIKPGSYIRYRRNGTTELVKGGVILSNKADLLYLVMGNNKWGVKLKDIAEIYVKNKPHPQPQPQPQPQRLSLNIEDRFAPDISPVTHYYHPVDEVRKYEKIDRLHEKIELQQRQLIECSRRQVRLIRLLFNKGRLSRQDIEYIKTGRESSII